MGKGIENKNSYLFLVIWKGEKNHFELFEDLETLCRSYPKYSMEVLENAFAYHKYIFEDDDVRIEKKTIIRTVKPDLPRTLFWDVNYDLIDWQASKEMVIQRVLERGLPRHWEELERFYSRQTIVSLLKEKITYLPTESINDASSFFKLKKEEMLCYRRKQSHPIHFP